MSKEIGIATPVATVFAITVMAVLVSQSSAIRAPAYAHYVPHYTRSGEMILPPKQCLARMGLCWVTTHPQRAQQWQGIIPGISQRLHPWAYAIYKRTNQFPNGTNTFKELQLTSGPAQHPDRSRTEQSGRGYFPGVFNRADVTVKDTKRIAVTGGPGYFNFNHHKPRFEVDGDYILGFTTFGVGAAEFTSSVQIAINAGLPYHDTARRYPQSLHIVGNTKKTAPLFTKRTIKSRDSAESRIKTFTERTLYETSEFRYCRGDCIARSSANQPSVRALTPPRSGDSRSNRESRTRGTRYPGI